MKGLLHFVIHIALLLIPARFVFGMDMTGQTAPIHRFCTIQAGLQDDPAVVSLSMDGLCAQDIFSLLNHESVLSKVSENGVQTKVGEGITCMRTPAAHHTAIYRCEQLMNSVGAILPETLTSPELDPLDKLAYSRIIIKGATAAKIYEFLSVRPIEGGLPLGAEPGAELLKFAKRIACSQHTFASGRPAEYECGQRLKTNGKARGTVGIEFGGSVTGGNMVFIHESRD